MWSLNRSFKESSQAGIKISSQNDHHIGLSDSGWYYFRTDAGHWLDFAEVDQKSLLYTIHECTIIIRWYEYIIYKFVQLELIVITYLYIRKVKRKKYMTSNVVYVP